MMTCNTANVTVIIKNSIGLRGIIIFICFNFIIENGIGSVELLNKKNPLFRKRQLNASYFSNKGSLLFTLIKVILCWLFLE